MKTSQNIAIEVEAGINLLGRIIYRSESEIKITILSPYTALSGSLHIPTFSEESHTPETDYGEITEEQLLTKLYDLGRYMDENSNFLQLQIALHFYDGDWSSEEHQKRFFGSSFPFMVPLGTREDVLNILRSK